MPPEEPQQPIDNVTPLSPYQERNKKKLSEPKEIPPKRISANTPGTLAYVFKRNSLDNNTVYAFLQHIQDEDPRITALLADYDSLTEAKQGEATIWDKLARKHELPVGKLYGKLAEATLRFSRSMGYHQLAQDEPLVLAALGKAAQKQKNLEHMRLFLQTSGAIDNKGNSLQVNFNQTIDNRTQQVFGLPPLDQTLRGPTEQVREANERLLESGDKSLFIDAEAREVKKEEEKEKELVPR